MCSDTPKRELRLMPEWGVYWPLSDVVWDAADQPNWEELITEDLRRDLIAWQAYFNQVANLDTGSFGGEDNRKWFDLEAVRLFNELRRQVGHLYNVTLDLWF